MHKLLFIITFIVLSLHPQEVQSQTGYIQEIKQTAEAFINTLDPLQKKIALLSFNDVFKT